MPKLNNENLDGSRKGKPFLDQTQSTHSKDAKVVRAHQTRRDDDTIKTPRITFETIDVALIKYITEFIQPRISDGDKMVDVPVIYADGDVWNHATKFGFIRDSEGKVNCPVIAIRRLSATEREELKKLDVNRSVGSRALGDVNRMYMRAKYNYRNRYDKFSKLVDEKPSDLLYSINIPEYLNVEYEIILWTDYISQMNELIEQMMPHGGFAWGDTYKFVSYFRDYNFDNVVQAGEERIIRSNISTTVKGILVPEHEINEVNLQKAFSIKKVDFDFYVVTDPREVLNNISYAQAISQGKVDIQQDEGGETIIIFPQDDTSIVVSEELFQYLFSFKDIPMTYQGAATYSGAATLGTYTNPDSTVYTTPLNSVEVYVNGQFIDRTIFIGSGAGMPYTISVVGSNIEVVFDESVLGYTVDSNDAVVIRGRFA